MNSERFALNILKHVSRNLGRIPYFLYNHLRKFLQNPERISKEIRGHFSQNPEKICLKIPTDFFLKSRDVFFEFFGKFSPEFGEDCNYDGVDYFFVLSSQVRENCICNFDYIRFKIPNIFFRSSKIISSKW